MRLRLVLGPRPSVGSLERPWGFVKARDVASRTEEGAEVLPEARGRRVRGWCSGPTQSPAALDKLASTSWASVVWPVKWEDRAACKGNSISHHPPPQA